MTADRFDDDIAALESWQDAPSTPQARAVADALAARLGGIAPSDPASRREVAVRGLLAACNELYRSGDRPRARELARRAAALSGDIDPALRIRALLRCGELELLDYDVAAALVRTSEALDVARASGRPLDEAQAWVGYGMALDWAGLYAQADEHWAHALRVAEGLADARFRGNVWALRCPIGFRLRAGEEAAAAEACRQALACAAETPARYRDSMACTALCNWAALELQRGRTEEARAHLDRAASLTNLGVRPRWLIEVLRAMAAVRGRNAPDTRAALDALLEAKDRPAVAYVIETYSVMAAMYADMGDAERAGETLAKLSRERAQALWAMLRGPGIDGGPLGGGLLASRGLPERTGDETTDLLVRLAVTAELRDDATGKHCFRVGRLAMLLGRRAGLPEASLAGLDLASRLHDIGKLAIPDAILLKPGGLDATEMHLMRSHAAIGADILERSALPMVELARGIARHHHERWDGGGYPDGLAGEAIPLPARAAALADVYDALTHERPYKRAWTHAEAVAYIAEGRGTQFDPRLAGLFLAMLDEARRDLGAFEREIESAAADSPYVVAQSRVARAIRAEEAA